MLNYLYGLEKLGIKFVSMQESLEKLKDCVRKAVEDLEARKHNVGAEVLALNERLEEVRGKKERLGIAFADGTINESLYKQRLGKLN